LTIGVLFQQLLFGPLSGSYMRYFSIASERKEIPAYLSAVKKSALQSTLISILLFSFIILLFYIRGLTSVIYLLIFSFLFMLFSSYNNFMDNLQNAARQRIVVAWHQGIGSWLKYLLAIVFIFFLGSTSQVAMFSFALSAVVVLASQFFFFKKSDSFRIEGFAQPDSTQKNQWNRSIWVYATPFIMWGIFTWAQLSSDRWALGLFTSTADVGLYTALYQIGYYPVSFLSGIFLQFISPIIFQWSGDTTEIEKMNKSTRFIRNLVLASLGIDIALTIITLLFHKEIFRLFVASLTGMSQISYPGWFSAVVCSLVHNTLQSFT
jgi:O-antigen/teichoic acid export membrane protein